jgi:hypothetical protein
MIYDFFSLGFFVPLRLSGKKCSHKDTIPKAFGTKIHKEYSLYFPDNLYKKKILKVKLRLKILNLK